MTRLLTLILGRLPIGWLQLRHNKARLAAAVLGVAFANVLVLVQIAIMGSMTTSLGKPYGFVNADIMISAPDSNAISEGSNVARQWMLQALGHPQVSNGTPLFVGNIGMKHDGRSLTLVAFALDPGTEGFFAPEIRPRADLLHMPDSAIIDRHTRGLNRDEAAAIRPQTPSSVEIKGRTITLYDTFAGGGGFGADGYLITSDQTFLTLQPGRSIAAPNHILLAVTPGADPARVAAELHEVISDKSLRIRTLDRALSDEINYQQTKRPTGIILGFGVVIGLLVGLVIVYQVLSTDVADHLREYATFKAMGYRQRFLLSIVLEEAVILATLGAIPGLVLANLMAGFMRKATGLPMYLTGEIIVAVFFGTIVACTLSGALAARRLATADPADLF